MQVSAESRSALRENTVGHRAALTPSIQSLRASASAWSRRPRGFAHVDETAVGSHAEIADNSQRVETAVSSQESTRSFARVSAKSLAMSSV